MRFKALIVLIICICNTFVHAVTNDKFGNESSIAKENNKNYALTKQAIVLNTQIDDIQQLDPRLKSIIMYAHYEAYPVHIYYYSEDNKRYVTKLLELFKANKVNFVTAEIILSTNLVERNLIKIYLGEMTKSKI